MNATADRDSLTRSVEDYLKAIYRLSPEGRPASTSEIAHLLELSAPSVSGMVKRLSELGLLEHMPYKGVQLTDAGRRAALRMVRRHRLIEAYLVEFLGYSWDTVHQEAERLEHAVSDTLVERMAAALGHPAVDPHGDPIPAADGSIRRAGLHPALRRRRGRHGRDPPRGRERSRAAALPRRARPRPGVVSHRARTGSRSAVR